MGWSVPLTTVGHMKVSSCKGTMPGQTLKIACNDFADLLMISLTASIMFLVCFFNIWLGFPGYAVLELSIFYHYFSFLLSFLEVSIRDFENIQYIQIP